MNKELKDYSTEELEARFDLLNTLEAWQYFALDGDDPWNNWVAIDTELGRR